MARSPWRRRIGIGLALLAAAAAAALFTRQVGKPSERSVDVAGDRLTTAAVEAGEFDDFIQIRGRFVPLRTVYLDTVHGGQVEAIHVENGAAVERGQVLVELSNTSLQLDVISREAQITEQLNDVMGLELAHERNRLAQERETIEVEYQVARLRRQIQRSSDLTAHGAAPRGELEAMRDELQYYERRLKLLRSSEGTVNHLEKAQLVQLRTAAKQLQANLDVTRQNLAGLTVKATVAGQLTAFNLEVGQSLAPGERLGQIDDPSQYKILADIEEFYLGRVDIGQRAVFREGETDYALTVTKIRPQVNDSRFQTELEFESAAPERVRRGQTAQMRLQLGQPTRALLIPNAAFFDDTGGAWVFVVSADRTRAVKRSVRLGRKNPRSIEVLEGLRAGEEIVTSSYAGYLEVDRLDLTSSR